MMETNIIVTDMDEVLVGLNKVWVSILNERYGTQVEEKDLVNWNIEDFFPTLTRDQIYSPLGELELWKRVEPIPGSVENITKLKEKGNRILVVTASHYRNVPTKIDECLLKYFPFFGYKDITMCHNKGLIKCDYIIDDYHENFVGSSGYRILMNKPYNQGATNFHKRVDTWDEIYRIIEE